MARQANGLQIEGTIGNLTFYKTKKGYFVKQKSNLDKKRIQTDPAYARTRENNKEFGHVAKMGRLIRQSLGGLLRRVYDPSHTQRLVKVLTRIKNLDPKARRGERTVGGGMAVPEGLLALRGFDFNRNHPMHTMYQGNLDWSMEEGWLKVGPFLPQDHLNAPSGATHVDFKVGVLTMDWATEEHGNLVFSTEPPQPITEKPMELSLGFDLPPKEKGNRFLVFQVRFLMEDVGELRPLGNDCYTSLQILEIE